MPNGYTPPITPTTSVGTPIPYIPGSKNSLHSIAATSPDDVWVVGSYHDIDSGDALILHWDGVIWNLLTTPGITDANTTLYAITAITPNDVWIAGIQYDGGRWDYPLALTLHWNGSSWSHSTNQYNSPYGIIPQAIAASSPDNIWMVGNGNPLLIRYQDQNGWVAPPYPNLSQDDFYQFEAVAPIDPHNVFLDAARQLSGSPYQAIVLNWDGTTWHELTLPFSSYETNLVDAISLTPNKTLFVGHTYNDEDNPGTILLAQLTKCVE